MSLYKRTGPSRNERDTYLLLCEGESEVFYFKKLKEKLNPTFFIIPRKAKKNSPKGILSEAKSEIKKDLCDHAYCIVDLEGNSDPHRLTEMEEILGKMSKKSRNKNIDMYPSNPSFELWLILHFHFTSKPFANSGEAEDYLKKITGMTEYKKTKYDFNLLYSKLTDAKNFAEKLDNHNHRDCLLNPATKIHLLVEHLKSLKA